MAHLIPSGQVFTQPSASKYPAKPQPPSRSTSPACPESAPGSSAGMRVAQGLLEVRSRATARLPLCRLRARSMGLSRHHPPASPLSPTNSAHRTSLDSLSADENTLPCARSRYRRHRSRSAQATNVGPFSVVAIRPAHRVTSFGSIAALPIARSGCVYRLVCTRLAIHRALVSDKLRLATVACAEIVTRCVAKSNAGE